MSSAAQLCSIPREVSLPVKALICGGGVGGLASALALKRQGFDVTVCERYEELRTAGVGLNLWPNGVRVIQELGLRREFIEVANVVSYYRTLLSDGTMVSDEDVGSYIERFGAPVTGIFRRDLSALLAKALGAAHIRFGQELTKVEDFGDRVECHFANGNRLSGDFLVGADGIYSRVRTHLFGPTRFRTERHVRWRGVFAVGDAGVDPRVQLDVIGPDGHFGWVAIGKGRAYWYAAGEHLGDKDSALSHFRSWTSTPVPAVVAATPDETIIRSELIDFEQPLERWGRGRITLLGDAAHPMLPGIAQGASQALEDALALAVSVSAPSDLEQGLRGYEEARLAKATDTVALSRDLFEYDKKMGELGQIHTSPIVHRYVHGIESVQQV